MNGKPSPVLVVCATVVAVAAIAAIAVLVASDASTDTIALLIGLCGTLVANLIAMGRTEQIKGTVDDLANGKMDAKIRAAVSEVIRDEHIDPEVRDQLDADFERRNEGH